MCKPEDVFTYYPTMLHGYHASAPTSVHPASDCEPRKASLLYSNSYPASQLTYSCSYTVGPFLFRSLVSVASFPRSLL